jgi:hypothetical protein
VTINYTIYGFLATNGNGLSLLVIDLSAGGVAVTNTSRAYRQLVNPASASSSQMNVSTTFIAVLTAGTAYSLAITPTFAGTAGTLHYYTISLFRLF